MRRPTTADVSKTLQEFLQVDPDIMADLMNQADEHFRQAMKNARFRVVRADGTVDEGQTAEVQRAIMVRECEREVIDAAIKLHRAIHNGRVPQEEYNMAVVTAQEEVDVAVERLLKERGEG